MSRRDPSHRLGDILAARQDALAFTSGIDPAAFAALPSTDRRTFRAMKNALTEIGEAVKALPPGIKARHPAIDWRGWAGLRDVMSHEYFRLEMQRLYLTVTLELPDLLAAIRAELSRSIADPSC